MAKHRLNGVTFWRLFDLIDSMKFNSMSRDGKIWMPARPIGWTSWPMRFKAAWMVWRCQADIVIWPGGQ